ncbi:MAG: ATP-dependent helicase [Candidatus Micrarchaeia archaeon]
MKLFNLSVNESLNLSQFKAVEFIDKPLLVLAGAGSGKTRVITYKIAHLILNGFSPHKILAITFTKKAANEMKERVKNLTSLESKWISTFHSFCLKVLREHVGLLNIGLKKDFAVYDDDESFLLFKAICKDKYYGENDTDRAKLFNKISYLKQFGEIKPSSFKDYIEYEIFKLYEQALIDCNAVDFDNIQLFANKLLSIPELRNLYKERFNYILIDEFQDTSPIQYQIVRTIIKNGNITVVGDPQQSIYSFRGAVADNIFRFINDYNPHKIKLEENYRSSRFILHVANSITDLIDKKWRSLVLELKSTKVDNGLIKIREFDNEYLEAQWIAENIKSALTRTEPKEMAIFVRSRYVKPVIKEVLRKNNIIFDDLDDYDFFYRAEVKDTLSYLKFAYNPSDYASFERAITTPKRGIGQKTLKEILNIRAVDYLQALKVYVNTKKNKKIEEILNFIRIIEYTRSLLNTSAEALRFVIKSTNYIDYLKKEYEQDAEDRYATLIELYKILGNYDSFRDFLDSFLLTEERKERNVVKLMTVHAAKGLEYDIVFLPALEEGVFPDRRSQEDKRKFDEEVRLFYVGVTRARKELYLSGCWSRKRFNEVKTSMPGLFFRHVENLLQSLMMQKLCVT